MPLEMAVEDLKRDLAGCVVMHQNKPVYVTAIGRTGIVGYRELITQKEDVAPFTLADFTNPVRRIGFVNIMNSILYLSRLPVRKYYMGLSIGAGRGGNLKIQHLDDINYPQGAADTVQRMRAFCIPELGNAIMCKYPNLQEAVKQVQEFGGACAFDKQFAVDNRGYVYYKTTRVGTYKKTIQSVQEIVWTEGKEHLSILLENNHEKTVRDFRPTTV